MPDARPVFVDPTGRRRRTVRIAAIAGVVALLSVAGLLVAGLLGTPLGPLTFVPEPVSGPPPAVEQQPSPTTAAPPKREPAVRNQQVAQPAITTTTTPPATTTSATKGKPATPPGRPTDLPTPPGHTR